MKASDVDALVLDRTDTPVQRAWLIALIGRLVRDGVRVWRMPAPHRLHAVNLMALSRLLNGGGMNAADIECLVVDATRTPQQADWLLRLAGELHRAGAPVCVEPAPHGLLEESLNILCRRVVPRLSRRYFAVVESDTWPEPGWWEPVGWAFERGAAIVSCAKGTHRVLGCTKDQVAFSDPAHVCQYLPNRTFGRQHVSAWWAVFDREQVDVGSLNWTPDGHRPILDADGRQARVVGGDVGCRVGLGLPPEKVVLFAGEVEKYGFRVTVKVPGEEAPFGQRAVWHHMYYGRSIGCGGLYDSLAYQVDCAAHTRDALRFLSLRVNRKENP